MKLDTLQRSSSARRLPQRGLRLVDRAERETFPPWAASRQASASAGALAELGIRPGERVALVYPTAPTFFDAFFGTLLAGAVPVPLYPPVRLGRLAEYHVRTAAMLGASGRASAARGPPGPRASSARLVERAARRWACEAVDELRPATAELASDARPTTSRWSSSRRAPRSTPKPVALTQRRCSPRSGRS